MSLATGTRLGPYEIVAPAGAGGMGEVYKARDRRLDRFVAIKILPAHLRDSAERRQRFEREARAIAALNHPHICSLYDISRHDDIDYLVMELLDGHTLADRLARGPLPIADVLRFGTEIAGALDRAHRQGIAHRDLKPANIMVSSAGIKLLDFGLAKQQDRGDFVASATGVVTADHGPLTAVGTIVGTLPYMAPEQLTGGAVDYRADIFACGAVLYEMSTGRRAFGGDSSSAVASAVLTSDPLPLRSGRGDAPAGLDRLVRRCLAKDPDERWQSARDLMFELAAMTADRGSDDEAARPTVSRVRRLLWPAWAAVATIALAAVLVLRGSPPPAASLPAVRFAVRPPAGGAFSTPSASIPSAQFAVSPDGSRLAYSASLGRTSAIWIRALDRDDETAQSLAGTEGASYPFWEPNGRAIGFFAQGKLKTVLTGGGAAHVLADASDSRGGTWNGDGTILFVPRAGDAIFTVPASGGEPRPATRLDRARQETSHRWPNFLPDGRHFLYHVRSGQSDANVFVGTIDSSADTPRHVLASDFGATFVPPSQVLFVRDGALMAQRFDPARLSVAGDPVEVAPHVAANNLHFASFSASDRTLAYARESFWAGQLVWFDRKGSRLGVVGDAGDYVDFALSPDGRSLAASRVDPRASMASLWLVDLSRGATTRLTTGRMDASPSWSPDGRRLAFRADVTGLADLYLTELAGAPAQSLVQSGVSKIPSDWSADGESILFHAPGAKTGWDVWMVHPTGGPPTAVLQTSFNETQAQLSADGRWLAYVSDQGGQPDVYVQPFGRPGTVVAVSAGGGIEPRWRRDGRELFYLTLNRTLMAVSMRPSGSMEVGTPMPLFETRVPAVLGPNRRHYVVSADGQRFLVNTSEAAGAAAITVVLNWTSGLK